MKTIDRLRAERAKVAEQVATLDKRLHELDAAIYEAEGDLTAAEWHRLVAAGDPGSHRAWVRLMAAGALRSGLPLDAHLRPEWRTEIEAEVERLRSESASGAQGEAG